MLRGRGWGQSAQRGFSGENPQKTPKFGDGDGERLSKSFGETLGTGTITISGILGVKSQKISVFWGGDKGRILGDFPLYKRDPVKKHFVSIFPSFLHQNLEKWKFLLKF